MGRAKLWITGLALVLVAAWTTEDAFAGDKMRVCVLKIAGARGNDFNNDLVRLINQPYSILKSNTFYKAAKRMRIGKRLSPKNLRRLSKFLRLGAIIDGTLVAKNGQYRLVLKVRDGKTGVVTERIRHTLKKKEMSSREKSRLRRDMINALERIRLDSGAGKTGPVGDDDDDDDEVDDDEEDVGDDDDDEEVEEVAPKRKTAKQLRAERRAKARAAREARRKAAADKRRKANQARAERARKAKEAREARADKRRKARQERARKRKEAAAKRKAAREKRRKERIAARKGASDEESDEEGFDDLEDEEDFDDLEDEEGFDDEEDFDDDLEDEEDLEDEGEKVASSGDGDDDVDDDPLLTKKAEADASAPIDSPAVVLDAGLGATSRSLSFTSSGLMDADIPIDYEGGFVPTVGVELELYPLQLAGSTGFLANLGFDAHFEQAATLSSTVDPDGGSADNAFDVDTTYRRSGAGLRYRMGVGPVKLALRAGYGQSNFSLDKGSAMGMVDIPNTKYAFLDPGVDILYPMGSLSIDAGAKFLLMLSAGEIQRRELYGQASIIAFDVGAGVNYAVTTKIGVRLGLRLAQMAFDFKGTGELLDRNGDGTDDVTKATDQYLGASLTGNYRF